MKTLLRFLAALLIFCSPVWGEVVDSCGYGHSTGIHACNPGPKDCEHDWYKKKVFINTYIKEDGETYWLPPERCKYIEYRLCPNCDLKQIKKTVPEQITWEKVQ